jgi:hypothetical protein
LLPGALLLGGALYGQDTAAPVPVPHDHVAPDAPMPGMEHHNNVFFRRLDVGPNEMETVTFLGVEASPVSRAMIAQLALPDHAGLVVEHVVPKTAADDVLKTYDILLKLDDQILIDQHQLSVLIRNHAPGDEVTLTYMRGGKTATARVKLGKHDAPKFADVLMPPGSAPFGLMDIESHAGEPAGREHVERMLSMIDQAHQGEPVRIEIEHGRKGEGMRAVKINTANSNLVYTDDDGSLELTLKDGKKSLVAKDAKGQQQFAGPATTDEERSHIPDKIRARLEKLESMHDVSFHTGGEFERFESDVAGPEGKGVHLLLRSAGDVPVLSM